MKRLIAFTNGYLKDEQIPLNVNEQKDNMMPLQSLDSAEVKNNNCPMCSYAPLEDKNGYKVCKNCGATYKVFKDNVYMVG